MVCPKHDALRQEWIAARADYQLSLADLQITADAKDFREALQRANRAFSEYHIAESALNEHVRAHHCSSIPAFPPVTRPLSAA